MGALRNYTRRDLIKYRDVLVLLPFNHKFV